MDHDTTPTRIRARLGRRTARQACGLLAIAALVGACGSDATSAPTTSDEGAAAVDGTSVGADPAAVEASALCDAWVVVDREGSSLGDPDATPEAAQAATQAIADALADVEAPSGLDEQLASVDEGVAAAVDGDPAAFDSPAFTEAVTALGAWVHDGCGFEQVEVTTVDHAFEGLDAPLAAGPASFHVVNEGEEAHVLVLHRFVDGSDATAEDLFATDQPEGSSLEEETEPVVSGAFTAPGQEGYLTAELEPGRYVVFCPIPVGFTGDGPPPADAPPHLSLGMYAELTVS